MRDLIPAFHQHQRLDCLLVNFTEFTCSNRHNGNWTRSGMVARLERRWTSINFFGWSMSFGVYSWLPYFWLGAKTTFVWWTPLMQKDSYKPILTVLLRFCSFGGAITPFIFISFGLPLNSSRRAFILPHLWTRQILGVFNWSSSADYPSFNKIYRRFAASLSL
jgi:hypothetical protein